MPLSTSVMVDRDEVLDLLDETIERLPDELRAARWLLKEREEYLAKVRREGEEILDQARTRAERMVQRTEVVKASEARARKIVDAAEDEAGRLQNEVEDFCDQKLASFEIVLERTLKMVGAGREKLQGSLDTGRGAGRRAARLDDDDARAARRCSTRTSGSRAMTRSDPADRGHGAPPPPRHPARRAASPPRSRAWPSPSARVPDDAEVDGRRHARVDRRRGHRHRHRAGAVDGGVPSVPRPGRRRGSRSSSARSSRSDPIDGETYPLDGDEVDLEPVVRDAVLLHLPARPALPARLPGPRARDVPGHRRRGRLRTTRPAAPAEPTLAGPASTQLEFD